MKILITGANGQLAKTIIPLCQSEELFLATRKALDITNRQLVIDFITKSNPDIVFHFASMTRGDECAKNPEQANLINVEGTKNVVEACKNIGASILFVSTNEVFDGKKRSPYHENDTPNPITVVGKTKYEAELYIKKNLKKYFIVRTSWLYSKNSANFIHAVINKAKKDKEIQLVSDEIGSPTNTKHLSLAIIKLITLKKYGTYHLVNRGFVSRLDFAKKAFEICGLKNVKIHAVNLDDYNRLSKPPLFSALENIRGAKLSIKLPTWEEGLSEFLNEITKDQ